MNYVLIFLHYLKIEKELKKKKYQKIFIKSKSNYIKKLPFNLTKSQEKVLDEINKIF